jgi:hypothetical protein
MRPRAVAEFFGFLKRWLCGLRRYSERQPVVKYEASVACRSMVHQFREICGVRTGETLHVGFDAGRSKIRYTAATCALVDTRVTVQSGRYKRIPCPGTDREGWWRRRGSNPRPSHCERDALPAELRPRRGKIIARWVSGVNSCLLPPKTHGILGLISSPDVIRRGIEVVAGSPNMPRTGISSSKALPWII